MTWTTPGTFTPNALAQSAWMNTYVRDNLAYLYAPPTTEIKSTTAYNTTAASYVDIDASLEASIVTTGGRLLILAQAQLSGTNVPPIRWLLDGVAITDFATVSGYGGHALVYWTPALTAGAHTIKPQWYSTTGTVTMSRYYICVRER